MPKGSREPRYRFSDILIAILEAGIPLDQAEVFIQKLHAHPQKRGRKEEEDAEAVQRVLDLEDESAGLTINRAAATISEEYPESQREAVRKRLARKAKVLKRERIENLKAKNAEMERLMDGFLKRLAELGGDLPSPK